MTSAVQDSPDECADVANFAMMIADEAAWQIGNARCESAYPADFRDVEEWRSVPDSIAHDAVDVLMAMVANLPDGSRKQAIVRAVLALVAMRSPHAHVVPVDVSA